MSKKAELHVPEKYHGQWHCLRCGFEEGIDALTFDEAMDIRDAEVMADLGMDICPKCGRTSFWLIMDYPPEITNRAWGGAHNEA